MGDVRGGKADDKRLTPRGDDVDWSSGKKDLLDGVGPKNAQRERRYELVERLEQAARGGPTAQFWNDSWEVPSKQTKKTVTFAWRDKEQCVAGRTYNPDAGTEVPAQQKDDENMPGGSANATSSLFNKDSIAKLLEDYLIDVDQFGKGQAKTLDQFMGEVQLGSTRLMVDGSQYKKMVRVVDVVLVRVAVRDASGEKKYLVEMNEKYPDGRKRAGLNRLAGTKRKSHETVKNVVGQIVKTLLGMQDCKITFDFKSKEVFEEEEESPSYPGVRTVYRKEILEGLVTSTDIKVLKRINADAQAGMEYYSFEDSKKNTKFFKWLTEVECKALSPPVRLRAPKSTGTVSGLVPAPIEVDEEALKKFLSGADIDVDKFGEGVAKTLHEFAEELSASESSLTITDNGSMIRVVDMIALVLMRADCNDTGKQNILLEAKVRHKGGIEKVLDRLPGTKLQFQEGPFQAAHRLLERTLQIDESFVHLNDNTMRIIEETKDSPNYPGVRTLYRKRIITGELTKPAEGTKHETDATPKEGTTPEEVITIEKSKKTEEDTTQMKPEEGGVLSQ